MVVFITHDAPTQYVKLKRKKNNLMGSLQLAHNGHVDVTDRAIAKARYTHTITPTTSGLLSRLIASRFTCS